MNNELMIVVASTDDFRVFFPRRGVFLFDVRGDRRGEDREERRDESESVAELSPASDMMGVKILTCLDGGVATRVDEDDKGLESEKSSESG